MYMYIFDSYNVTCQSYSLKSWEMIHIAFKQKKLRLQGHAILLKDRRVVVSAWERSIVADQRQIRKGLEGDFVLWGSRETQWEGGWGLKWNPRESESNLPRGAKRAGLQVGQGA